MSNDKLNLAKFTLNAPLLSGAENFLITAVHDEYSLNKQRAGGRLTSGTMTIIDSQDSSVYEVLKFSDASDAGVVGGKQTHLITIRIADDALTKMRGVANDDDGTDSVDNVIADNIVARFEQGSLCRITWDTGGEQAREDQVTEAVEDVQNKQNSLAMSTDIEAKAQAARTQDQQDAYETALTAQQDAFETQINSDFDNFEANQRSITAIQTEGELLKIDISGGAWLFGTSEISYAGVSGLAQAINKTIFYEVDSSGVLQSNESGFTSGRFAVAKVITDGTEITSITNYGTYQIAAPSTTEFPLAKTLTAGDVVRMINDGGVTKLSDFIDIETDMQGGSATLLPQQSTSYVQAATDGTYIIIMTSDATNDVDVQAYTYDETYKTLTSAGSAVQLTGFAENRIHIHYDSTNDRFVCLGHLVADNQVQGVVVKNVTGTLTQGTAITIGEGSAGNYPWGAHDSTNGKSVAVWQESADMKGKVLTVSDMTLSAGTVASAGDGGEAAIWIGFDDSTDKFLIHSHVSGTAYARVASVSGTTLTLNAQVDITIAGNVDECGCCTDGSGTFLSLQDEAGGTGRARALTISGTTVDAKTAAQFSASAVDYPSGAYNAVSDKFSIVYQDEGDSDAVKALDVSVDGSYDLTFGTEIDINGDTGQYMEAVSVGTDSVLFVYRALTGWHTAIPTNFSSVSTAPADGILQESGVLDESKTLAPFYSNSDVHSGLTIGARYFMQSDFSLGTTRTRYPMGIATTASNIFLDRVGVNRAGFNWGNPYDLTSGITALARDFGDGDYDVPAGKVLLITAIALTNTGYSLGIYQDNNLTKVANGLFGQGSSGNVDSGMRDPIIARAGDSVRLVTGGWWHGILVDENPLIKPIVPEVSNSISYTVPEGKVFVVTSCYHNTDGAAIQADTETVWTGHSNVDWGDGNHKIHSPLFFTAGQVLTTTGAQAAGLLGYLVNDDFIF